MSAVRDAFRLVRPSALTLFVSLLTGPAALAHDASADHTSDSHDASADGSRHDSAEHFGEIETHHIFGFTDGADIAPKDHREFQFITRVDHGRCARSPLGLSSDDIIVGVARGAFAGSYRVIEQSIEFEHTPTDSLEYSIGASAIHHRIHGVEGIEDFTGLGLKGLFGEVRYVLARRGKDSPVGVTVQTQPEWSHVSEAEGRQQTGCATSSRLVVDAELVPRLYGAVNLIHAPEIWRFSGEPSWRRASTLGLTGGLVYRVTPKVALGWGLQYYRTHASLGFDGLTGQALFGGPTLYVEFTDKLFLSAAFSFQMRGHAAGESHALDLSNFPSRMGWLLIGWEF